METNLPTHKFIMSNCDEKISTILKCALRSRQFRSFGKRRPRCSEVRVRLKRVWSGSSNSTYGLLTGYFDPLPVQTTYAIRKPLPLLDPYVLCEWPPAQAESSVCKVRITQSTNYAEKITQKWKPWILRINPWSEGVGGMNEACGHHP